MSFTSTTGSALRDSENCRGSVWRANNEDRSAVVNQNRFFQCPNDCSERKLWVEDTSSHARKLVKEYQRSLDIAWTPDSRLFFVNDNSGSTDARCYVYEAASLKETDVAKVVLARYPHAEQFVNSGHSYLRAKRWLNSHALLVVLTGHNDAHLRALSLSGTELT